MLVRRPADPARFNGIAIVEWLNVTGGTDLETAWPPAGEYMLRNGYAYIGVTAQAVGWSWLKHWDPVRYASLVHPGDDFSFDIFTQAMQAIKHPERAPVPIFNPAPVDPMGGERVRFVVANGASQSGSRLTSYLSGGYHAATPVADLFQITRSSSRPFAGVKIFQLNEESQNPPADTDDFVVWTEAGAAHAPAEWQDYISHAQYARAAPGGPDAVATACSINRATIGYSARAYLSATRAWLEEGVRPPSAPRVERDANGIVRDANGLAKGGLRHPFVHVPIAYNSSEGCPLFGLYKPWSVEKIRALYPTHDDYVTKVRDWAAGEVAIGWLLPEDYDDVVRKAEAFDVWTTGSCYDSTDRSRNESGPVSSALRAATYDPNTPLNAPAILHYASCEIVVPIGL
jgi:hypothetical protein